MGCYLIAKMWWHQSLDRLFPDRSFTPMTYHNCAVRSLDHSIRALHMDVQRLHLCKNSMAACMSQSDDERFVSIAFCVLWCCILLTTVVSSVSSWWCPVACSSFPSLGASHRTSSWLHGWAWLSLRTTCCKAPSDLLHSSESAFTASCNGVLGLHHKQAQATLHLIN